VGRTFSTNDVGQAQGKENWRAVCECGDEPWRSVQW
jgi:hypothetical protein